MRSHNLHDSFHNELSIFPSTANSLHNWGWFNIWIKIFFKETFFCQPKIFGKENLLLDTCTCIDSIALSTLYRGTIIISKLNPNNPRYLIRLINGSSTVLTRKSTLSFIFSFVSPIINVFFSIILKSIFQRSLKY